MGKKPFIDKKAAKHFHVVHRSQKDPLINDAEAPDRVLREVLNPNLLKVKKKLVTFLYICIIAHSFFSFLKKNIV